MENLFAVRTGLKRRDDMRDDDDESAAAPKVLKQEVNPEWLGYFTWDNVLLTKIQSCYNFHGMCLPEKMLVDMVVESACEFSGANFDMSTNFYKPHYLVDIENPRFVVTDGLRRLRVKETPTTENSSDGRIPSRDWDLVIYPGCVRLVEGITRPLCNGVRKTVCLWGVRGFLYNQPLVVNNDNVVGEIHLISQEDAITCIVFHHETVIEAKGRVRAELNGRLREAKMLSNYTFDMWADFEDRFGWKLAKFSPPESYENE